MKKVFFGLTGGIGPTLRCTPIASYFKRSDVDVYFSMYDKKNSERVENLGYKILEDNDPTIPSFKNTMPNNPLFFNLDQYYAQSGFLDFNFTKSWIYNRISMLKNHSIDLAISDLSPHTIIAAKFLGIPVVTLAQSCFHPKGEKLLPIENPPKNLPTVTPIFNKILKELQLNPINNMEELMTGDIDIIPSIPEFDPVNCSKVEFVGPIEGAYKQTKNIEIPEKCILVYPGRMKDTAGNSGLKLVQSVVSAFSGREECVRIVVNENIPKELEHRIYTSPNIKFITSYNPEQLKNCSLFIHHGGHGSCLSSIIKGTPSLVIPTHSERFFNAKKIKDNGVGEYLLLNTFTPQILLDMAKEVITNKKYNYNLLKLKEKTDLSKYGGAHQAYKHCKQLII